MSVVEANAFDACMGCGELPIPPQYILNGASHRHSRDEKLLTPSDLEGSSGSSGIGCRVFAGVGRLPLS